jgi:O-antigen ligase
MAKKTAPTSTRPSRSKVSRTPAQPMTSREIGSGSLRGRWGLPDVIGLTIGLSMVLWWPWPTSTTSLMAVTILTVSMGASIPWVIRRWQLGLRPQGIGWVPVGAAAGLWTWAVASLMFSGVPWPVGFYGWTGRQDGVLALTGVLILMAAAASLRRPEIERVFTWLLLAGAVLVVEALAQQAGWTGFRTSAIEGVWAAMGNPNFLGAMCGLLSAVALARALDKRYEVRQRVATAALWVGLASVSVLSLSAQGPLTVLIATAVVLGLRAIQWRGPQRIWVAVGLGLAAVVSIALTVFGLLGSGPLTRLWASESTGFRKTFWDLSWRIMNGLPLWGTGPDGLARYVGEYRTEQYIIDQGADDYLNAAHNVPLQYGATIGLVGLVFWIVLFASAAVLVLVVAWRSPTPSWISTASGGLLALYISQALISIDDLRLKEMGWLAVGLTLALMRRLSVETTDYVPQTSSARTSSARQTALSVLAGIFAFVVCLPPVVVFWSASDVTDLGTAESLATNPLLPWDKRLALLGSVAGVADLQGTWAVGRQVAELDPRGPGQAASLTELAVLAGDSDQGVVLGELAVSSDPLNPRSWLTYSLALAKTGQTETAWDARAKAEALNAIRPLPDWPQLIEAYERKTSEPDMQSGGP